MKKFLMSAKERESLFLTELVKVGVDFQQATKAAKVLALAPSDEQLTPEEQQLVQNVCNQWLAQRKRMDFISQVLNESQTRNGKRANSFLKK